MFGSEKENFLRTAYDRLKGGHSVRAIRDTWASVTFVADLVKRTKEILERRRYGVYQVVNEGTCSYHRFVLECARLANLSDEDATRLIECVTEEEMSRLAPRPRWTPMRCVLSEESGLPAMRDWQSALADYVTMRSEIMKSA